MALGQCTGSFLWVKRERTTWLLHTCSAQDGASAVPALWQVSSFVQRPCVGDQGSGSGPVGLFFQVPAWIKEWKRGVVIVEVPARWIHVKVWPVTEKSDCIYSNTGVIA